MTNGGFAAIAVTLRAIVEPGDEVIFLSPPWFFYELLIVAAGGTAVRVTLAPPGFDLDPAAIEAAITPRTRAIIVNTPHNPSGRVYPAADLAAVGAVLEAASQRHGRTDPSGRRRAVQPDRVRRPDVPQPGRGLPGHDHDLLVRQDAARAGHAHRLPRRAADDARPRGPSRIAVHRPDRDRLRVPERPAPARDRGPRAAVDRRRGARAAARPAGRRAARPWATRRRSRRARSTSWPRRPSPTTRRSPVTLAEHGVLVLPGTVVELPGWFRISLTASERMVDTAIRGFAAARDAQPAQAVAAR